MKNLRLVLTSIAVCLFLLLVCALVLLINQQQQLPLVVMTPSFRSRWKRNRYASSSEQHNVDSYREIDVPISSIRENIERGGYQVDAQQSQFSVIRLKPSEINEKTRFMKSRTVVSNRVARNWLSYRDDPSLRRHPVRRKQFNVGHDGNIHNTLKSTHSSVQRFQRRIYNRYHHYPLILRRMGDYYDDPNQYLYDDEFVSHHPIEERQSYSGGGGYYPSPSSGCCGASSSSSSLSSILRALLLSILIPMALLLSLTILFLFAAALRSYTSCLLGSNVTVNGIVYNCGGLFGGIGGFNVISIAQQQQQQQQQQESSSNTNTNTNSNPPAAAALVTKNSDEPVISKITNITNIVKPSGGELFAGLPFFIFNSSGLSQDEKLIFHNHFDLDDQL